jgi:FOG: CBS domain
MNPNPIFAYPQTSTVEALQTMREERISCLPIVDNDNTLVGVVTEYDFIKLATKILENDLRDYRDNNQQQTESTTGE